jgi:hypothetical protein
MTWRAARRYGRSQEPARFLKMLTPTDAGRCARRACARCSRAMSGKPQAAAVIRIVLSVALVAQNPPDRNVASSAAARR